MEHSHQDSAHPCTGVEAVLLKTNVKHMFEVCPAFSGTVPAQCHALDGHMLPTAQPRCGESAEECPKFNQILAAFVYPFKGQTRHNSDPVCPATEEVFGNLGLSGQSNAGPEQVS